MSQVQQQQSRVQVVQHQPVTQSRVQPMAHKPRATQAQQSRVKPTAQPQPKAQHPRVQPHLIQSRVQPLAQQEAP